MPEYDQWKAEFMELLGRKPKAPPKPKPPAEAPSKAAPGFGKSRVPSPFKALNQALDVAAGKQPEPPAAKPVPKSSWYSRR